MKTEDFTFARNSYTSINSQLGNSFLIITSLSNPFIFSVCILHHDSLGCLEAFGRLQVGSCPNDDNSVQILFGPFLCSF